MTECIKAHRCQYMGRHCAHHCRIYDGYFWYDGITSQGFLVSRFRIGKHPETIAFRAGATGCRNYNKRQRLITGFTIKDIIVNVTFVNGHKCNAFCTVHDRAATNGNDHITAFRFSYSSTIQCSRRQRIRIHLIKQYMFNMCRIKFCRHTVI